MSDIKKRVEGLIVRDPKYREILERIVKVEEDAMKSIHKESEIINRIGWEWHHVQAYPAELMKLVREGIVDITYKSRRYTHYKLKDREAVKEALKIP